MAAMVPWAALEAIIEPHYPKIGPQGGRRPLRGPHRRDEQLPGCLKNAGTLLHVFASKSRKICPARAGRT
jgi:hypothetical protein